MFSPKFLDPINQWNDPSIGCYNNQPNTQRTLSKIELWGSRRLMGKFGNLDGQDWIWKWWKLAVQMASRYGEGRWALKIPLLGKVYWFRGFLVPRLVSFFLGLWFIGVWFIGLVFWLGPCFRDLCVVSWFLGFLVSKCRVSTCVGFLASCLCVSWFLCF